jgi:hypothetical protein
MTTALSSGIAALVLAGCGAHTPLDERPSDTAASPAGASGGAPASANPPLAAELSWMSALAAERADAPLVLPSSFFGEDPRYSGLVPEGALESLDEEWSNLGRLEHLYSALFRVVPREDYLLATAERLRGLGRTMPVPRASGAIQIEGEPRVELIPIASDRESMRVSAWFAERATRDRFAAFVAALPEVAELSRSLELEAEPTHAMLSAVAGRPPGEEPSGAAPLSRRWTARAVWRVDRAGFDRLTRRLPELGFTYGPGYGEEDGNYWRREEAAVRVSVVINDYTDGFDAMIVAEPSPE